MADIVLSSKKKINIFDRVIQSVVILVNINKMNRAIDEHLQTIRKCESDDQKKYQENVLREIVFVKYQYDIMQRQMYDLKCSYPDDIIDNINSNDKIKRLKLQKSFLEMEYDRLTKAKFKSKEDIKYGLVIISATLDTVKQDIKDEGKAQKYNKVIKTAEDMDQKIAQNQYQEQMYTDFFEIVNEYVEYLNDNYDISKLPIDERELIEYVIEIMIKGIESDIDKHLYEFTLITDICRSSYRYFKIIDKVFEKIQKIYDESYETDVISLEDYVKMYKEIYDTQIKTMVNDIHRTIKTEDEYFEYSKLVTSDDEDAQDKLKEFIIKKADSTTKSDAVKERLEAALKLDEEEQDIAIETIEIDDKSEVKDDNKKDEKSDKVENMVIEIDEKPDKKVKKVKVSSRAKSKNKKTSTSKVKKILKPTKTEKKYTAKV